MMKAVKSLIVLTIISLSCSVISLADNEDRDYAVPAITDFQALGLPNSNSPQMLSTSTLKENINPFPTADQIKWFDINRDLQINDFDVKQFQEIIKSLHGEKLSGLQLLIRFRIAQKNQKGSFPILYDLDRDGMFTSYDVDYFTELINKLDEGRLRGTQLVQKFKSQIQTHQ